MQLEKEYFNKDKWLVSARRIIQIFAFILFFFLIFHTQKVKELDISIPIYLFVTLILTLVIYLYRFLILYFKNNIISKSLLTKTITVILFTIFLFFLLSHYKQFSKPNRITYLNNKSITIKAAISQYENDKKRYNSFKNFTSLKTSISNKADGSIEIILPPFLLYINYLFLLSAIILFILSIFFVVSKRKSHYLKHYVIVSIIFFMFSILVFILLEFNFKANYSNYKSASGNYSFILNFFPTDFSHYYYYISIPQNLFLKSSSLIGIITSLALRTVIISIAFVLFFIIISTILGRVFCGWICPFGTFHQFISFLKMKIKKSYDHEIYLKKQKIKYIILVIIFVTAIFSINYVGFLDPISILSKSTSVFLVPSAQYPITTSYDFIHSLAESEQNGGFYTLLDNLYLPIKEYLDEYIFYQTEPTEMTYAYVPTHYEYFFLNGVIFIILITLNLKTTRFWCRYICPLGALFGIFANRSVMRVVVNNNCTSCGECEKFCQGAADVSVKNQFKTSECMYCFNCINNCSSKALDVRFTNPFRGLVKSADRALPIQKLDISKRIMASSLGIGIGSLLLFRSSLWEKRSNPKAVRPPGSVKEADFLRKCIKCSECMKVCPKNFLHPAFLETGIEGMFTPIGVGKLGYCEHTCNACGQVCPTQAIENLKLEKKQKIKIGLAIIRKDRCLTYASQTPCVVCEEHCPTSPKAIWTTKTKLIKQVGSNKKIVELDQINVDPDLCIGCAVCEYVCPVVDKPAIFVASIQESRSKENQLLLRD